MMGAGPLGGFGLGLSPYQRTQAPAPCPIDRVTASVDCFPPTIPLLTASATTSPAVEGVAPATLTIAVNIRRRCAV